MSTKVMVKNKDQARTPKIPGSLAELLDKIINPASIKAQLASDEKSWNLRISNPNTWSKDDAVLIMSYLFREKLREKIRTKSQAYSDPKNLNPEDVFDDVSQLKAFTFILECDPYRHYNLSYYKEKLKNFSSLVGRVNKFILNVFDLIPTLVKSINFDKFHDNLYVSVDKFLLIGYDKDKNELTFDINLKEFGALSNVRKYNKIGLGLLNFESLIYYRTCTVADENTYKQGDVKNEKTFGDSAENDEVASETSSDEHITDGAKEDSSRLFLEEEVVKMVNLFGLSKTPSK